MQDSPPAAQATVHCLLQAGGSSSSAGFCVCRVFRSAERLGRKPANHSRIAFSARLSHKQGMGALRRLRTVGASMCRLIIGMVRACVAPGAARSVVIAGLPSGTCIMVLATVRLISTAGERAQRGPAHRRNMSMHNQPSSEHRASHPARAKWKLRRRFPAR